MTNPLKTIRRAVNENIKTIFGLEVDEELLKLEMPPDSELGNLGLGCFPLAKLLKQSPVKIAETFEKNVETMPFVKEVRAAGPYVNLVIEPGAFIEAIYSIIEAEGDKFGCSTAGRDTRVMVEYSAPNTNKPQHLGHVRNNVLGVALINILSAAGYSVSKVNLVNDRGIHICKSMLAYQKWGNNATPESAGKKGDHFVGDYYVMYEQKAKENPYIAEEARDMLQAWENGDKDVVDLWKKMNGWVFEGFDETYKRLSCEFDKIYLESDTYKLGKEIVLDSLEKGILKKNKNGDIVVDMKEFDIDEKVLLRSDGTSVYITQDIGTSILKYNDYKFDKTIFIVASEQKLHFQMLFSLLKKLGYDWADNCFHLSYGMVYLPEGKMKSREGKVVDADELMEELHSMAKEEILKRAREMEESELENVSESVGLGALKYYILKVHPLKDIHFSPEDSLSFDGATGPYAQYSYARLSSILRKGEEQLKGKPDFSKLGNTEEVKLALLLAFFPQTVSEAAISYNPARISSYIFDLSKAINKLHHEHSVLKTGDKELTVARGGLIRAARQALANSLRLLGITPLERM